MVAIDKDGAKPISACFQLWLSIFNNILINFEEQMGDETQTQLNKKIQ